MNTIMLKRVSFFVSIWITGLLFSCQTPIVNDPNAICVTAEAYDITATKATLSGYANLTSDMTGTVKLGFIVSTDPNPSINNSSIYYSEELSANNKFTTLFANAKPSTQYYYKAFVLRNDIYQYGEAKSFMTSEIHVSFREDESYPRVYTTSANVDLRIIVKSDFDLLREKDFEAFIFLKQPPLPGKMINVEEAGWYMANNQILLCYYAKDLLINTEYTYQPILRFNNTEIRGDIYHFKTTPVRISIRTLSPTVTDNQLIMKGEYSSQDIISAVPKLSFSVVKNGGSPERIQASNYSLSTDFTKGSFYLNYPNYHAGDNTQIMACVEIDGTVLNGDRISYPPMTASEAYDWVSEKPGDAKTEEVYIKGIICSITAPYKADDYGNAHFYLSDDGKNEGKVFQCYR